MKGEVYTCPNCTNLLDVRQGPVFECFAHKKNIPETRECELYSGTWGEERAHLARTPLSELDASRRKIRLAVRRHPYKAELELIGLLQTPSMAEWLTSQYTPWLISSEGLLDPPVREDFHPRRGRAELHLDASHTFHRIHISSGPTSLIGQWDSNFEPPLPRFVGSIDFAEATDSLGRLRAGQYLYLPDDERLGSVSGEKVSVGIRKYRGIEVSPQLAEQLDEILGGVAIDQRGFEARVILPAHQPPFATSTITGPPESPVLIYVVSSPELPNDPPIEVLELPSATRGSSLLPAGKHGVPRQLSFQIPKDHSRRFVLYWSGRQVYVQASPETAREGESTRTLGPTVSLDYNGSKIVSIPASFNREEITSIPEDRHLRGYSRRWSVKSPSGLLLALEYRRESEDGSMEHIRREEIPCELVASVLESTLPETVGPIFLDCDLLGVIGFEIDRFSVKWMESFDFEASIRKVGFRVGHVNWEFVRAVIGLPPGTNPRNLPGGLKKRIRRANKDVLENRGDAKQWKGRK